MLTGIVLNVCLKMQRCHHALLIVQQITVCFTAIDWYSSCMETEMLNPVLFKLTKASGLKRSWSQIIETFLLCFVEANCPYHCGLW